MNDTGTYTKYPELETLPTLVRVQRRLEAKLGDDKGPFAKQESEVRKDIDKLLAAAGLERADFVTCNGYQVTRRGQSGRTFINELMLTELLIIGGFTREEAVGVILEATDRGEASTWSEVKPLPGAKVRK